MTNFRNAARLADYLGGLYPSDGYSYRLIDGATRYGHLDAVESDHGLEIRLLMIDAGARDRGYCLLTLHTIVEAADSCDATLVMKGYPLPFAGCACGFAEMRSLGFRESAWNAGMLERQPFLRVLQRA